MATPAKPPAGNDLDRRADDQHPAQSPDASSIALTIIRLFLGVRGFGQLIAMPAAAFTGILTVFCVVGVPAILASATVVTSWRNQELQAATAAQQVEIEQVRMQMDAARALLESDGQAKPTSLDEANKRIADSLAKLNAATRRLQQTPARASEPAAASPAP